MIFGKKITSMVTHSTQLVFVITILTLYVRTVENIELCQKMTIKNCASNFHEVFEAFERRNSSQLFQNCVEVQVFNERTTIFCMSIFPYRNVLDLVDPVDVQTQFSDDSMKTLDLH